MSDEPLTNTISHTVKPGETLSIIAQKNGITVAALLAANPNIQNANLVQVNQVIQIPKSTGSGSNNQTPDGAQNTPPAGTGTESTSEGASLNAILELFQSAGASAKTAKQDHLPGGVASSETMAKTDRNRVMASKEKFKLAARDFNLPPALLAAIASRESRGGAVLKNGFGDGGHGFGIMQVDDRNPPSPVQHEGGPAGQPHINQATKILADKLKRVRQKFPDLSPVEQLQMAVSQYNGGAGKRPPNSDQGTTGGDYMNDVWARARFYARVEDWS
jgi:LysM repeat protein